MEITGPGGILPALARNPLDFVRPRTVRIGVTGLARAGKTVLLTAIASVLLQPGALGGRLRHARVASGGADVLPRFDHVAHRASLAADPPSWPARTDAVSLLALDLAVGAPPLPPRSLRLELLDYPGEWLLDLEMLGHEFGSWSRGVLDRLRQPSIRAETSGFLAFADALPPRAPADEALAAAGHALYAAMLARLRDARGLSMLQPGRFLMPPPGAAPPWMTFFPLAGASPLAALLARRYDAYVGSTRDALLSPLFGRTDRLVILADLLGALGTGPEAFADAATALGAAAAALRRQGSWAATLASLAQLRIPPPSIRRIAFVASKADHVSERQRGNLAALTASLAFGGDAARDRALPFAGARSAAFAVAAARCTEDFVWSLDGHPVSAVRGRIIGDSRLTRFYPGEVPDTPPPAAFWAHRFLSLPAFEPARIDGRQGAVPNIGIERLLAFLLDDLL